MSSALMMSATGGANSINSSTRSSPKPHDAPMTRRDLYFALRCGIVNVGPNPTDTAVGRVTLVNWDNEIVVDTFVKVPVPVTNYRTQVTGITPGLLEHGASSLHSVRKKVGALIRGKILIGHGLEVDLAALGLSHPWCDMRDTATYAPYMQQIIVADVSSLSGGSPMLVPRNLDDLMQHALQQPVPPGQPLLVSEAAACLSLYKAVREQWENELVKLIQQKERQKQLVLHMRSAPASCTNAPALSRIAEDRPFNYFTTASNPTNNSVVVPSEREDRLHTRGESVDYDTSTLATEQPNSENGEVYRDDLSETSSYLANDGEVDGTLWSRSRHNSETETDLYPMFENLHLLPELQTSSSDHHANGTIGSNTAAGSQLDEWTFTSLGASQHSGIWSPLQGAPHSVLTSDWSYGSTTRPTAIATGESLDVAAPSVAVVQVTSTSLSEDELRGHLPANLLDDLEGTSQNILASSSKDEQDEPKKKSSWFGLVRRRRTLSAPSEAEAGFSELKLGQSKFSLSDRLPTTTGMQIQDEIEYDHVTDDGSALFNHFSKQPSMTTLPPGF